VVGQGLRFGGLCLGLASGLGALPGLAMSASASLAAGLPPLRCALGVPASARVGRPLPLRLTLHNRGRQTLWLLVWGTPFEQAWLAPFVSVQRDGRPLDYRGAVVKRGDPGDDEYLAIAPGQRRQATLDLAEAFDLDAPGHYHVQPQLRLHDWVVGDTAPPRQRARHQGAALACASVDFRLLPRRP